MMEDEIKVEPHLAFPPKDWKGIDYISLRDVVMCFIKQIFDFYNLTLTDETKKAECQKIKLNPTLMTSVTFFSRLKLSTAIYRTAEHNDTVYFIYTK